MRLQRKFECWTRLPVTVLELWNCSVIDSDTLFGLLAGLPLLKELHLRKLVLQHGTRTVLRRPLGAPILVVPAAIAAAALNTGAAATQGTDNDEMEQDDPNVTYLLHFAIGR